jgi:hypothetical protein
VGELLEGEGDGELKGKMGEDRTSKHNGGERNKG